MHTIEVVRPDGTARFEITENMLNQLVGQAQSNYVSGIHMPRQHYNLADGKHVLIIHTHDLQYIETIVDEEEVTK